MNFTSKSKTKCFWYGQAFYLMTVLSVVLLLPFAKAESAMEDENAQHFKMLSTIEYTGEGQFRNQAETIFTARNYVSTDQILI